MESLFLGDFSSFLFYQIISLSARFFDISMSALRCWRHQLLTSISHITFFRSFCERRVTFIHHQLLHITFFPSERCNVIYQFCHITSFQRKESNMKQLMMNEGPSSFFITSITLTCNLFNHQFIDGEHYFVM